MAKILGVKGSIPSGTVKAKLTTESENSRKQLLLETELSKLRMQLGELSKREAEFASMKMTISKRIKSTQRKVLKLQALSSPETKEVELISIGTALDVAFPSLQPKSTRKRSRYSWDGCNPEDSIMWSLSQLNTEFETFADPRRLDLTKHAVIRIEVKSPAIFESPSPSTPVESGSPPPGSAGLLTQFATLLGEDLLGAGEQTSPTGTESCIRLPKEATDQVQMRNCPVVDLTEIATNIVKVLCSPVHSTVNCCIEKSVAAAKALAKQYLIPLDIVDGIVFEVMKLEEVLPTADDGRVRDTDIVNKVVENVNRAGQMQTLANKLYGNIDDQSRGCCYIGIQLLLDVISRQLSRLRDPSTVTEMKKQEQNAVTEVAIISCGDSRAVNDNQEAYRGSSSQDGTSSQSYQSIDLVLAIPPSPPDRGLTDVSAPSMALLSNCNDVQYQPGEIDNGAIGHQQLESNFKSDISLYYPLDSSNIIPSGCLHYSPSLSDASIVPPRMHSDYDGFIYDDADNDNDVCDPFIPEQSNSKDAEMHMKGQATFQESALPTSVASNGSIAIKTESGSGDYGKTEICIGNQQSSSQHFGNTGEKEESRGRGIGNNVGQIGEHPNFEMMSLDQLHDIASQYGLKRDTRERMVRLLELVWRRMNSAS